MKHNQLISQNNLNKVTTQSHLKIIESMFFLFIFIFF